MELAKQRRKMESGQVLELRADDEGARGDVPIWCEQTGNEFLGSEKGEAFIKYFIKIQ